MKERILITGASGFVGYHLIEAALHQNLEVFAAVRRSSQIEHLKHLDIQYTTPDFASVEALKKDIEEKKYSYIIHAAGSTKAPDKAAYTLVNTTYAVNLASAATGTGVKKFVFISSLAALGPAPDNHSIITESQLPKPVTNYGRSKLVAETHLKVFEMSGLPLVTLRPTAVYGPRDKDIFIILKTFTKGFEPYIGNNPQQLSFVYVTDLARAAVQLALSNAVGSYNISDGNAYDRYALANITKKLLQQKTLKLHLPVLLVKGIASLLETFSRKGSTPALNREKLAELTAANWNCSIEKLRNAIGYKPQYDLEKGLTEALEWYKKEKWL